MNRPDVVEVNPAQTCHAQEQRVSCFSRITSRLITLSDNLIFGSHQNR